MKTSGRILEIELDIDGGWGGGRGRGKEEGREEGRNSERDGGERNGGEEREREGERERERERREIGRGRGRGRGKGRDGQGWRVERVSPSLKMHSSRNFKSVQDHRTSSWQWLAVYALKLGCHTMAETLPASKLYQDTACERKATACERKALQGVVLRRLSCSTASATQRQSRESRHILAEQTLLCAHANRPRLVARRK